MRGTRNTGHWFSIAYRGGRWLFFAALLAVPLIKCSGQGDSPDVTFRVRTGPTASARLSEDTPPVSVERRERVALVVAAPSAPAEGSAAIGVKPAAAAATSSVGVAPKETPDASRPTKTSPAEDQRTNPKPEPPATTPTAGPTVKINMKPSLAGLVPAENQSAAAKPQLSAETPRATVIRREKMALVIAAPSAPVEDPAKGIQPPAAKAAPAVCAAMKEIADHPNPPATIPPKTQPANAEPKVSADNPPAAVARPERVALVVAPPLPPRQEPRIGIKPAETIAAPAVYARLNEMPNDPKPMPMQPRPMQPRPMELIAMEGPPVDSLPRPAGMVALQGPLPNGKPRAMGMVPAINEPAGPKPVQMLPAESPPVGPRPIEMAPPASPPMAPRPSPMEMAPPPGPPMVPRPNPMEMAPPPGPPLVPRPNPMEMAPVENPPLADGAMAGPYPPCYRMRCGVYCNGNGRQNLTWHSMYPIPWEAFAQGEYIGPARLAHVPDYRLRVDDQLDFVYIFSVKPSPHPYRLGVGDSFRVGSLTAPESVDAAVSVQLDGTVTLRLLGQVRVLGMTLEELRQNLEERYQQYLRRPAITITPMELNIPLEELRKSVERKWAAGGGQGREVRVTPEGTVQLPVIGSIPVQGLSLTEAKREIEARYDAVAPGIEVTPILQLRAPRFFFVVGEVKTPGRFSMEGPTTVLQAIAMAGSWNVGAHLEHVVVLRRDENWCLMATKLNLRAQLLGHKPCRGDEIWLRDSDIVIVPKSPLLEADDFIDLVFTRGIYRVFPMVMTVNFAKLSTL